jgi:thiamine pyrophosphokinase
MRSAFIFCGGGPSRAPVDVPSGALVVAADVGLAEAVRLGVPVDLLVGDLDSVAEDDLAAFRSSGGEVRRHPEDKDATDLELAIEAAVHAGARRVVVVGGDGGRLDHLAGNVALLASSRWAEIEVDAVLGAARVHVVRDRRQLDGAADELVSLLAVGGPAHGVTTEGLRWSLDRATLEPGSSLGISNRFVGTHAVVAVDDGVVLALRPGDAA